MISAVHAVVAVVLGHRAGGVGGEVLHRRRLGGGGGDDRGVLDRAGLLELLHQLGDGGALLADGDVDAVELLALVVAGGVVVDLLVEDGVERDRGLAGLAVADDELALAAADRDERVDRLEAGRHRLVHRLARDDARRLHVGDAALGGGDRALAVDRVAEGVDHAAEQRLADGHVDDRAGALDDVALADVAVGAEDHDADVVGLEVQRHAADAAGKLDHLAGLDVVEPVDARDPVADREHPANLRDLGLLAEVLDLLLQDRGDFSGLDGHYPTSFKTFCRCASLERIELSIIREPTLTTMPPIRLSSTVASILTSLPTLFFSVAASCFALALGERLGGGHLGGDLAALCGNQRLDLGEQAGDDEEAAVLRHQPERAGDGVAQSHGSGDRGDRPALLLAAVDRRGEQGAEVGAGPVGVLDLVDVALDLVEQLAVAGDLEERGGVTAGDP